MSAAVLQSVSIGSSDDAAAEIAGISPRTLRRWLARGRDAEALIEENGRSRVSARDRAVADFCQAHAHARARSVEPVLERLRAAALLAVDSGKVVEQLDSEGNVVAVTREPPRANSAGVRAAEIYLRAKLPHEFNRAALPIVDGGEAGVGMEPMTRAVAADPRTIQGLKLLRDAACDAFPPPDDPS